MKRFHIHRLVAATLFVVAHAAAAQLPRTRSPGGPDAPAPTNGIPRDPHFPYAGLWSGTRTMPMGSDQIRFRFSVADGKYSGEMIHPGGGIAPHNHLSASAAGLTWDSPNSGGGTWVYNVRLAGPDSMVGTLVLRDPPPNLTPAPVGTLVLTRQPAGSPRGK